MKSPAIMMMDDSLRALGETIRECGNLHKQTGSSKWLSIQDQITAILCLQSEIRSRITESLEQTPAVDIYPAIPKTEQKTTEQD